MNNSKKCKGINKAKGIDGCGKESAYRKFGLCPSCLMEWATTNDNGKIWYKTQFLPKVKAKTIERKKKQNKAIKNSLTNWRSKLEIELQYIARLIDYGRPCLVKGIFSKQMDGGHVFGKGSNKTISLNIHNIHRQSSESNSSQKDDALMLLGLRDEYGLEYMNFVMSFKQIKPIKYTWKEYMDFYNIAKSISKELKLDGQTFGKNDRILKRNEVNIKLGIYEDKFCSFELKH